MIDCYTEGFEEDDEGPQEAPEQAQPGWAPGGEQADLGNWEFVPDFQSPGNDLASVDPGLGDEHLRRQALLVGEGVVAVTTEGDVKSALQPRETWQRVSDDSSRGMYVLLDASSAGNVNTSNMLAASLVEVSQTSGEQVSQTQAPLDGESAHPADPQASAPPPTAQGVGDDFMTAPAAAGEDPSVFPSIDGLLSDPEAGATLGGHGDMDIAFLGASYSSLPPLADADEGARSEPAVAIDGPVGSNDTLGDMSALHREGLDTNMHGMDTNMQGLFQGDPGEQDHSGGMATDWRIDDDWRAGHHPVFHEEPLGVTATVPEDELAFMDTRGSAAAPMPGRLPPAGSLSGPSARSAKTEVSENVSKWQQSTVERLNHARNLTKQAIKNLHESNTAHTSAQKFNSHSGVVTHTIRKKIGKTGDLCKALEGRIESIEDTIRQVGESLFQLQRAHRCKYAPLNVCERRLELREGRPIQELVRDEVHIALEDERNVLVGARSALEQQLAKTKETIIGLDRTYGTLREDLQHKRHALRIDRSCLSPKKPLSSRGGEDRLVLPSLQDVSHYGFPPSPKEQRRGTGILNEGQRAETTQELLDRAARAEEEALRLNRQTRDLMGATARDCAAATQQANGALARRVEETQHLKAQLEAEIIKTDETIAHTELSLAKTRQTLESHEKPLRALDTQFAQRGKRTDREGIRDPVHDEMEGHLEQLKKSVRTLADKFQNTKAILDQLRSSKQHMQEDYRNKSLAQKIDDACIKVTARKAMELDRNDPRGGRCREPARRKRRPVASPAYEASELIDALTF
mmetsp:Transcript_32755/g.93931  ORF Transcript_32755/g.93931 Transcript_32755/m.93931 type:complete len:802 (+) Transcript_32755:69-2474(+)